ncbi:LysR substrate-binding domain-containing protein [Sphingobium sp.]|uniref:LysR substrate-binding domain-containing protein n=1 Tax=Sphingobium sp. TaxID=1912891 RepID=UPI002CE5C4DC|nr:LysR substrate-binding domain-containing protein [Sphingobium sp.]HUD90353.1 LysR substrate-binding domain-containing protein [Sphingobium sp.]
MGDAGLQRYGNSAEGAGGSDASGRPALRITLRQLAMFEAVARTGSVARAADEIGLSPSAASMSLKELETHLGISLFTRARQRLTLSDRGRPMLEMARAILVQVADMEALSMPEELRGRLRIGAAAPVGNYVLPRLCADFMRRHPHVRIDLKILPSQDVMEGIKQMSLDIGFVGSPVNSSYLDARPWLRDALLVCAAPGSAQARRGTVHLADLAQEGWVLEKTLSSERISFTVEALKYINSLNILLETDSVEAVKRAVAHGAGLTCLSRLSVKEEIARGELVALDVPELRFTRVFSLVSRRDTQQTHAFRAFQSFAMRMVAPDEATAISEDHQFC